MSSNKPHSLVTKLILGEGMKWLHAEMDKPSRELGMRHRVVRHGLLEVAFNYARYGKDGAMATLIHIIQDRLSTAQKRNLKKLLDGDENEEAYRLVIKNLTDVEMRILKELLKRQAEANRENDI